MKPILLAFALLTLISCTSNPAKEAALHLQEGRLRQAREIVDAAYLNDPGYWYVRGLTYKELFKKNSNFDDLDTAINAFYKALPDREVRFESWKNLRYLGTLTYNSSITYLNEHNYNQSLKHYTRAREVFVITHPDTVFTKSDIEFNNAMISTALTQLQNHPEDFDKLAPVVEGAASRISDLDSNNFEMNYNMGVFYYNRIVDLIEGSGNAELLKLMDHINPNEPASLKKLIDLPEVPTEMKVPYQQLKSLSKEALGYMEKAKEIREKG